MIVLSGELCEDSEESMFLPDGECQRMLPSSTEPWLLRHAHCDDDKGK